MGLKDTFLNALGLDTPQVQKTNNSLWRSQDFLRYGNREKLTPDWADVKISDPDMYRGYSYAVIQKRGNKVASLARENLRTLANPEVVDEFQKREETPEHPYLNIIANSTKFTEKQFWKYISIYLDLAGRYYLGVVRKEVQPIKEGYQPITTDVQEFIMLNPYEIRRVIDKNQQVAGYIERKKDGRYREWPLAQIIEMRELNPFDPEHSQWAMTDAAKEAVYTLNQSGDYTRQSLNGNLEAPGIITTDVLLNDQDFADFRARVRQHTKGEPIFGNGTGAIKWDSMQIDLDKAALLDINEINRTTLFAVSGTSKTSLGIEQSGTTRETARVQSEQFVSDTAQPRLEDIVDFLNLDYKQHYPREFKQTGYTIEVQSAVGKDYDTETKATGLRQAQVQLALSLIQSGYTKESAYQYAEGQIELADLELEKGIDKPTSLDGGENPEEPSTPNTPQNPNTPTSTPDDTDENNSLFDLEPHSDLNSAKKEENPDFLDHKCKCHNEFKIENYPGLVQEAYNTFLKDVREIELETIDKAARRVTINAFSENDIIGPRQKKTLAGKLKTLLKNYWFALLPVFGNEVMQERNDEFDKSESFKIDNALEKYTDNNAGKVANGHLDTILDDILGAANQAYADILEDSAAELIIEGYDKNSEKFKDYFQEKPTKADALKSIRKTDILEKNRKIYQKAYDMAWEGHKRSDIVKAIREKYGDISKNRATLIARNETARAFTRSQYEADRQFLNGVGKMEQAYKVWYSRRPETEQDKICPYCRKLIEETNANPIPFETPFLAFGDTMEIVENGQTRTFTANYESIDGGTLHPNCACGYRIVFKNSQGEFVKTLNELEGKNGKARNNTDGCVYRDTRDNTNSDNESSTKELNGGKGSGNFGYAGRPGEVGGSASGKSLGDTDRFIVNEDGGVYDSRQQLELVAESNGFDKTPEQVSKEEYDKAIEEGGVEVFRGIHGDSFAVADEYVDDFVSGDYYAGDGYDGVGIYTTDSLSDADYYATVAGDTVSTNGKTLKMVLPKDMKTVKSSDIYDEYKAFQIDKVKEYTKKSEEAYAKGDDVSGDKFNNLVMGYDRLDLTTYAAMKGYDVVHTTATAFGKENTSIYVVLNRGKVIMEKDEPTIRWKDNKRAN